MYLLEVILTTVAAPPPGSVNVPFSWLVGIGGVLVTAIGGLFTAYRAANKETINVLTTVVTENNRTVSRLEAAIDKLADRIAGSP